MRLSARIGFAATLTLAVLLAPSAVLAAKFDHIPWSGPATEPDFCGSGVTVDLAYSGSINVSPTKITGHAVTIYTNPLNEASVSVSVSGSQTITIVDDADGGFTVIFKASGTPITVKPAGGGKALLKDSGNVTFYSHFDADGNLLGTDIVAKGPHPSVDSPDLFCEVMTMALSL